MEAERERHEKEYSLLQKETEGMRDKVQNLDTAYAESLQRMKILQEQLKETQEEFGGKLEEERRNFALERRIAKSEKTKIATKNKALKLKLKRHFDQLRGELLDLKTQLADMGVADNASIPSWPFNDDDFL